MDNHIMMFNPALQHEMGRVYNKFIPVNLVRSVRFTDFEMIEFRWVKNVAILGCFCCVKFGSVTMRWIWRRSGSHTHTHGFVMTICININQMRTDTHSCVLTNCLIIRMGVSPISHSCLFNDSSVPIAASGGIWFVCVCVCARVCM